MDSNQTFYRVKAAFANPSYDKRCKYGLQSLSQVPEGMLWILRRPGNTEQGYAFHVTPWGTADHKLHDPLLEASVESFPQTPKELLFVRGMFWLTAADVFDHLVRQHGWTASEVEQVLSELQLESEEKDGQNA